MSKIEWLIKNKMVCDFSVNRNQQSELANYVFCVL